MGRNKTMSKRGQFWAFVVVAFGLVLLVGRFADGSGKSALPTPTPAPAYSLAVIQTSGGAGHNDPLVGQFQHQLDVLGGKCQEPVASLADYTVGTHDILKQHSIQETYLSILTDVDLAVPAGMAPQKCDQIFAAWATLRIHTP